MSAGHVMQASFPASGIAARLPHRGRPSDRLERWTIDLEDHHVLTTHAAEIGLAVGTAGSLLVERGLLMHDLEAAWTDLSGLLDEQAQRATVRDALSDASAVYLRSLNVRTEGASPAPTTRIELPTRLTDRLLAAGGPGRFLHGDLGQARHWERAAVAHGATMTEWAQTTLITAMRVS